ncbi:MAG: fumarylacetoacetate hydrolase family protein [Alphaproteobacteria bacterium]|nr:fumarylacetoacetate hydrolase family protein [Alphaproteobacteria bacterium]
MTDSFVFAPAAIPSVAVAGDTRRFPVRRIFCVGRNYADHAREMGSDPVREPPFFFTKPADAVVDDGTAIPYPPETANLHHEIELVVAIGRAGFNVAPADALGLVFGYAVGLDMTRRDLQNKAKDTGRPWDWGKAFDNSAPCAAIRPVAEIGHPAGGAITLDVNGTRRQTGDIADLIWPVADVIAIVSRSMALKPGDLIYTGTPSGVGAVRPGDRLEGRIAGVGTLAVSIGEPA